MRLAIRSSVIVVLTLLASFLTAVSPASSDSATPFKTLDGGTAIPPGKALDLSTGKLVTLAAPTNCPTESQALVGTICFYANANDPNTARWTAWDTTTACRAVGKDQFNQSMNNRTSYIINNSTRYSFTVFDYTTCGQYASDKRSIIYANSRGPMNSEWDNIIGSVRRN